MDDVLSMKIATIEKWNIRQISFETRGEFSFCDLLHALSCLSGNIYKLDHLEISLQDVNVFVEAAALTPLGHNGEVVLRHVAHEQQDVDMSSFPAPTNKEEQIHKQGNATMQIQFR